MGTRNITTVKINNKHKVIQYCQWDGYPTGQGHTIAKFLKNVKLRDFKKKVKALGKYTKEEVENAWVEQGAERGAEFVSMKVSDKVKKNYPELSRDTGAEILGLIASGKVEKVQFATGQLRKSWIEFLYEINLDKNVVKVSLNGGRSFVKTIPFKKFTPSFMAKLEKSLYEYKYGKEEEEE